tara:strand:- start:70 stop:183 length:114 start_codon:yes stop_codon:yes gene_type:complete
MAKSPAWQRKEGKAAKRIKGEISSGNPKKEIFAVHIR